MSRCFPFPPSGYERQTRTDRVDLLAKERQKEKKRKKEKDKEKREGKDRKEKDRSKDKHKDKKDRKEKHKDKTKKERDKNPPEGVRADKQNDPNQYELGECSQKTKEINQSKFTEDLERRIKDEHKVAATRMVENFQIPLQKSSANTASPNSLVNRVGGHRGVVQSSTVTLQKRNDLVERPADNLLHPAQRTDVGFANAVQKEINTSQKVAPKLEQKGHALTFANAIQKDKNTGQKVAPKLELKGDVLGSGNAVQREHLAGQRLAPKVDQKGAVGTEPALLNTKVYIKKPEGLSVAASVEKENKIKTSNLNSVSLVHRTINGMSQSAHALSNLPQENTTLICLPTKIEKKLDAERNHSITGQKDADGNGRLMEMGRTDDKEDQGRKEEKQKDRDHKKHKSKHKHKEKDKEKEKIKEKSERRKKERDKLRDNGKKEQIDGPVLKPLAAQIEDKKSQLSNDTIKKRKEIEANGVLHENDPRLNKFQKTSPSFHHPVENGKRFEVSPVATNCLSIKPEATNNAITGKLPTDSKNHVTNVISEAKPVSVPLLHPDIRAAEGVPLKSHRDEKYLNQIYSVPKMEEWQEYDDQEWLFRTNQSQQKRQLMRESVELPQVWAEALRVESDDIVAMPYVIPF